jgi:hypothetical protein
MQVHDNIVGNVPKKNNRRDNIKMSVSVGHSSAILPDDGIASGTNWEDVPDDWVCPKCAMGKDDFDMVEI